MTKKFDTLESIFRMVTPSSFVGASSGDLSKDGNTQNIVQQVMMALFETPGGGVFTHDKLIQKLQNPTIYGTAEKANEFRRVISVLGPAGTLKTANGEMTWPYMAYSLTEKKAVPVNSTAEFFGSSLRSRVDVNQKPYSIITLNSPMISPQRKDAERCEIFLNSMPTIVLSRCVPYVEMEFGFTRPSPEDGSGQLQAASLMKFLLGADTSTYKKGSANKAMIDARRVINRDTNSEYSTAGMEMFTSPQTLVNLDPTSQDSRYTKVLDPMRPFATVMSLTIDTKPTTGVYSYKKATVQLKLHDRSRLSEIADFIRPTVYTQTTVWLTYGWRHPADGLDNPYATFINNNMLKREAFGIYNSAYVFDQSGGVDITLELYTKVASEVRTVKINQNMLEYSEKLAAMNQLKDEINNYRQVLGLDSLRPNGKEIRGALILDAAGRGSLPDFAVKGEKAEILAAIKELENNLKKGSIGNGTGAHGSNSGPAKSLIDSLKKMYVDNGKTKSTYAEVKAGLASAIATQFKEAREGLDPYLMFQEKNEARKRETGSSIDHPYLDILKDTVNEKTDKRQLKRSYASFAKVFSVFIANSLMTLQGTDEIQVCMYQMNASAGFAGGTNIAEFPIDMNIFEDAYRDEIEQKASDSFTIEEFLQLIIRTQIDDMRSIAYGFKSYYEPYSKEHKNAVLKDKIEPLYKANLDNVAGKLGPFVAPQLEVYMESVFARSDSVTGTVDLLQAFTSANSEGSATSSTSKSDNYRRILRIHVFDRALNPYESATRILRDKKNNFISVQEKFLAANVLNDEKFLEGIKSDGFSLQQLINKALSSTAGSEATGKFSSAEFVNEKEGVPLTNRRIKDFVSRAIPSITYGTNASTVLSVELSTKMDPLLGASQLTGLNKNKQNTMDPNGSGLGGLPLRVLPAQLSMKTLGCPLLTYAQFFFLDMNTGTSIDNVYGITGLVHSFVPGRYETQIQFGFYDSYGRFESAGNSLEELAAATKPPDTKK